MPRSPSHRAREAAEARLVRTYEDHYGFVWRSLRRLGVDDGAVDDAVHDVFVVAARRLHEFEDRAAITSWLFAVAIRVAQHHRRASARHRRKTEALAHTQVARPPRDTFARHDAARTLHALLERLDEPLRHVFILMEFEQMTGKEAAAVLKIKTATAHSRLRIARDQLRAHAADLSAHDVRRSA
jgi:RNA polymerase sigma-70 factor (ECF subfamily)